MLCYNQLYICIYNNNNTLYVAHYLEYVLTDCLQIIIYLNYLLPYFTWLFLQFMTT